MNVWLLIRDEDDGGAYAVLGVYATERAAQAAVGARPDRERNSLSIDAWEVEGADDDAPLSPEDAERARRFAEYLAQGPSTNEPPATTHRPQASTSAYDLQPDV